MDWFNIMANFYKNAFYDPSTTAAETVYTVPSDSRAIIQNIQITNKYFFEKFSTGYWYWSGLSFRTINRYFFKRDSTI